MTPVRVLLDNYTRTYPMNRSANELADVLRGILMIHTPDLDGFCVVCLDAERDLPLSFPCDTVCLIINAVDPGIAGGQAVQP
jgi:hypothetical protein